MKAGRVKFGELKSVTYRGVLIRFERHARRFFDFDDVVARWKPVGLWGEKKMSSESREAVLRKVKRQIDEDFIYEEKRVESLKRLNMK